MHADTSRGALDRWRPLSTNRFRAEIHETRRTTAPKRTATPSTEQVTPTQRFLRFGSFRFGSVRFGSVRFGSVRFGSVRFGSVRVGYVLPHP